VRESIMRMTWRACAAETSRVRWSRRCGMLSRPTWAYARATAWVKPAPPCVLTTSAGMREAPTKPAIDAVFTMAPPPCRGSCGIPSSMHSHTPGMVNFMGSRSNVSHCPRVYRHPQAQTSH
jgi:hypothetical protein